jgi:hypothetical protein
MVIRAAGHPAPPLLKSYLRLCRRGIAKENLNTSLSAAGAASIDLSCSEQRTIGSLHENTTGLAYDYLFELKKETGAKFLKKSSVMGSPNL